MISTPTKTSYLSVQENLEPEIITFHIWTLTLTVTQIIKRETQQIVWEKKAKSLVAKLKGQFSNKKKHIFTPKNQTSYEILKSQNMTKQKKLRGSVVGTQANIS